MVYLLIHEWLISMVKVDGRSPLPSSVAYIVRGHDFIKTYQDVHGSGNRHRSFPGDIYI